MHGLEPGPPGLASRPRSQALRSPVADPPTPPRYASRTSLDDADARASLPRPAGQPPITVFAPAMHGTSSVHSWLHRSAISVNRDHVSQLIRGAFGALISEAGQSIVPITKHTGTQSQAAESFSRLMGSRLRQRAGSLGCMLKHCHSDDKLCDMREYHDCREVANKRWYRTSKTDLSECSSSRLGSPAKLL